MAERAKKKKVPPESVSPIESSVEENMPRIVNVEINVNSIEKLNVVTKSFYVDVDVEYSWEDQIVGNLIAKGETLEDIRGMDDIWDPNIEVIPVLDGESDGNDTWIYKNGMVTMETTYQMTIASPFDLKDFPFDTQQLYFNVRSKDKPITELQFRVETHKKLSCMNNISFSAINQDEYVLTAAKVITKTHLYSHLQESEGIDRSIYCEFGILFDLKRKVDFYFNQIVNPTLLMSSVQLCVWVLPPIRVDVRAGIVLSLYLTMVAFQLVQSSFLPKINYNTQLDTFMNVIRGLFTVSAFEIVLVYRLNISSDLFMMVVFLLALIGTASIMYIPKWRSKLEVVREPAEASLTVHLPSFVSVHQVHMGKVMPEGDGGFGIFSKKCFYPGDKVYDYPSFEWPKSRLNPLEYAATLDMKMSTDKGTESVRITRLEHAELLPDGSVEFAGFDHLTNHSCDANQIYDEENSCTIATKLISIGDQLTSNYNCSNWDENSNLLAFNCNCGAFNCHGVVRGFKYLPTEEQKSLTEQGGVSGYCTKALAASFGPTTI